MEGFLALEVVPPAIRLGPMTLMVMIRLPKRAEDCILIMLIN